MQFSCNQDTFSKYLNIISRIVNNKPGLPILNNVFFETVKGKVILKVTDLELSISTWIGADVKVEGKVTVPAKQLSEFINSIPEEKVDVELDKQSFNISTENNSASFNTMPADDFPAIPAIADGEKPLVRMNKADFVTAVNRVSFAAARDDIKPVLTGIKIEIDGNNISFIGTDGLRLSRQIIKIEKANETKNILVPVRALEELAHIVSDLGNEDDFIEFYVLSDKNQVLFRFGEVDLVSRLIDGEFPEYKQIIPTGYKTRSEINKNDFINSLKVINIIARSVLGNKMILDIYKEGKISLSATQSDLGKNQSNLACKVEGEDIKIAFSAKLLSDVLNHLDSEEIVFECSEPVRPGVFKIKGDENFVHLVMPMML
jgi:DNA polymerase-3 subunit beta